MRAHTVRTAVALAAAGALLVACGSTSSGGKTAASNSATPAAELANAIKALGSAHTLNLTFTLGASGADLLQIAAGLGNSDGPTKPQADAISNDHIGVELQAPPGSTIGAATAASPSQNGAFALTLGDARQNYVILEEVNGALYEHIDLRYFLGLVNGAPSFASLERQIAGAPAFVHDALAGKWISIPASTVKSIGNLAQTQLGTAAPTQGKIASLYHALLSTFLSNVSVTRVTSGSTDDLKITFQLRQLISKEYQALVPALSALIPGHSAAPPLQAAKIPNVPVHLDAYVTNGALSKLVLDAGQFDTTQHISVPLELAISQQGPTITAPASSTPIDFPAIGQLLSRAGA